MASAWERNKDCETGCGVLTRWFGKESWFSEGGVVTVGRFGAVSMEGKGASLKSIVVLLILE